MIRYGIISTAGIVSRFAAGIRESRDGYVQAIASRTVEKARKAAEQLDIEHYYGSYQELYEDPDVDIVYIPTVNASHYKDCLNALRHHKHVIVEKPFTMFSREAEHLFEVARENQCFLMEAQKCVFLPTTRKLKELLEEQAIGPVRYIEFRAGFPKRFPYEHWMYDRKMGGGCLYGSASYTIELLQFLFGDAVGDITGTCLTSPTGSDEISNFQVKVNDEILVASTITMNVPLKNEAVFYGENGSIVVPNFWKSNQLDLYDNLGNRTHFEYPYQSEFVYEVEHIHECLKAHRLESPVMTKEKTIATVSLVERLQKDLL